MSVMTRRGPIEDSLIQKREREGGIPEYWHGGDPACQHQNDQAISICACGAERLYLVTTTRGLMEIALLQKREGMYEDDNERTGWTEYWDGGNLECTHRQQDVNEHHCACGAEKVHRSVDMFLKKPMVWADGATANIG